MRAHFSIRLVSAGLVSIGVVSVLLTSACTTTQDKPAEKFAAKENEAAVVNVKPAVAPSANQSAVNSDLVKRGYSVVKRNDQILYCRLEPVTGTQFKSNVCLTEGQLRNREDQMKDYRQKTITPQAAGGCGPLPCS